jgi:ribosomal protein L20A (L18A)
MKRWQITITAVEELPAEKVESHLVKYQIGA